MLAKGSVHRSVEPAPCAPYRPAPGRVVGRRLHRIGGSADSAGAGRGASWLCSKWSARCRLRGHRGEIKVLYTIVVVLLVLWVLGLVTSFTAGGLLHLLLVAAVVVLVYQLVTGRRGV